MKAATKSIFDKSYIIEAQAIQAAAKEFGESWAVGHKISFDAATKKFRVQPLKSTAEAVAELEHATHEVVAHITAKPRNPSGQARRQSDLVPMVAAAEAIIEEAAKLDLVERVPGFTNCPHCGINLENGVGEHGQEVNGEPVKHDHSFYMCLACGEEFGPELDAGQANADKQANASMGPRGAQPRLSICERPTKKVWDIADKMPKATRKEVMEECVRQGVAYGTARTQYQAWFKASQNANRVDIRQPYQKGE